MEARNGDPALCTAGEEDGDGNDEGMQLPVTVARWFVDGGV